MNRSENFLIRVTARQSTNRNSDENGGEKLSRGRDKCLRFRAFKTRVGEGWKASAAGGVAADEIVWLCPPISHQENAVG